MTFYIDNLTTIYDLEEAIANYFIDDIQYNIYGHPIWDRDVAIWALEHLGNVSLLDVAPHLANSARVVLAAYMRDNSDIINACSRFQTMSYNELYKAAMLEHLNDTEEDWSYDIKRKFFIDHGNCAIHMYDQDNEIWRKLEELEIDLLEDVKGLHYFIGKTRDGSSYNIRTGEIIG